jgi:hypothetical protein
MAIALDKPWFIYVLKDGRTGEIRYVGMTCNVRVRLTAHILEARKGKCHTYKSHWIASQIKSGTLPTIAVIESGIGDAWKVRERYWIDYHRSNGSKLTNIASGGEGGSMSDEHALAISKSLKGKKKSPEHAMKVANAIRGKHRSPEQKRVLSLIRRNESLESVNKDTLLSIYNEYLAMRNEIGHKKVPNGTLERIHVKYNVGYATIRKISGGRHWINREMEGR